MAFEDYATELLGYVPKLSILLAKKHVNRAWRDIRDSRRWSFLIQEMVLQAPGQITAGSASVTQFSTQVVLDATAAAAVIAAIVVGNPPITDRQFRVANGPLYNISSFNGVNTLTLERAYQEQTNATASYLIYRCFFAVSSDFRRWVSVFDPVNNYRMRRENLSRTKEEVDRADPQRGSFSTPIWMAAYRNVTQPVYEMWPHPVSQISYIALYERRGINFAAGESLPAAIPEDLLLDRARYHAYQWAMTQPNPDGIDWKVLLLEAKQSYSEQLNKSKLVDEETFLQNFSEDESGLRPFPIDANWLQSHDWI